MIKSIHIKNFQSHKDSLLEFDSGVNIIVGSTDSGKSAIIRALIWTAWNRPQGEAFRSNWGGDTEVIITTEEDRKITRRRTNSKNEYEIKDFGTFEAIRTDVPTEVQTLLNISEINIQHQLDQPFLISATSGEVAKHFNDVANLGLIDTARSNIESWIRNLSQELSKEEKNLEKYNVDLKNYDYLDKFEADVEVLEGMEERLHQIKSGADSLSQLIFGIKELTIDINKESEILQLDKPVEEIFQLMEKNDALDKQSSELTMILTQINITNDSLFETKEKLSTLQKTFERECPNVCPFCGQKIIKKHNHNEKNKT